MAAGWQARLPLFEIACVLARFDHIASSIVSANHSVTPQRSIPVTGAFSHPSAPTSLDRSGLSENHQGCKTGGLTVRMKFRIYVLIFGAEKSYGGIAQLVERLVRNESLTNTPMFSHLLSLGFHR